MLEIGTTYFYDILIWLYLPTHLIFLTIILWVIANLLINKTIMIKLFLKYITIFQMKDVVVSIFELPMNSNIYFLY